jgi:DNA-binding Lrp family transcriptional regulator
MPKVFVMMTTSTGAEERVLKRLREEKNVKAAYFVYGVYDIVTEVEAASMQELRETVRRIRKIPEARSTLTMIVMEESGD